MPNELKTAEKLIEANPDSALYILKHITPTNYKSASNRALYGLLLMESLDKKQLSLEPDSLINFSIYYYENHPDGDRLATCYLYKGRQYKYAFQYEKAITCYLKALDVIKNKENYLLLGRINSDIADIYLYQCEYKLANGRYLEAYKYFNKAKFTTFAYYSLINIGKSFSQSKLYTKAQSYFNKVYIETKDSMVKGFAIQYIGINYYESKRMDSAIVYLRKSIYYPYTKSNRALRYYYLADLYYDLNLPDSATYYAQHAFNYEPDIRTKRECYRILTNCESSKGNIKEMNCYMAGYQDCSDSIRKIDAQTKGSVLETIHSTSEEVVKTKHWVWYLVVVILFITVLSILTYFQLQKRKKRELSETEEKHREQKEILRKDMMLKHRQVLLHKIEAIKTEQSAARKKLSLAEKEVLDKNIYDKLLHFNDTVFFFRQMDAILNNLVSKLKDRYPILSDREISWCCLYLLNIPSTDILLLLNYQVNTLNKMKQRLAIKLKLQNAFELSVFLNKILSED